MLHRVIGLLILAAAVAMGSTPLYQSKFSKANADWTALRGEATADAAVAHGGNASLRVAPGGQAQDAAVRLARVSLTLGKTYELSGWIRTENLEVKDKVRTPIASGTALTMASMPFDVHSASLAGTQAWAQVTLKFVAAVRETRSC